MYRQSPRSYGHKSQADDGAISKVYRYDVENAKEMKSFIRDSVGNLEKVTMLVLESLESSIGSLELKMDLKFGQMSDGLPI
ncbi:hypothetical protein HOY82DRAFT_596579 [Tuber indicum]|nr:hypothetical protein HOY82DRAFT_596579 [Tuber indicum]